MYMVFIKREIVFKIKTFKPLIIIFALSLVLGTVFTVFRSYYLYKKNTLQIDPKVASSVSLIGSSLDKYALAADSMYPDASLCSWDKGVHFLDCLSAKGVLAEIPADASLNSRNTSCDSLGDREKDYQSGFCYDVNLLSDEAVVYTSIDPVNCPELLPYAFYVWSSADKKSGLICLPQGFQPTTGNQVFVKKSE